MLLLAFTIVAGMLMDVPRMAILNETIRNLYFHVPMWFGMIIILMGSVVYSVLYLRNPLAKFDIIAEETAKVGVLFGILGILTGMLWAKFTWGEYWSNDPKQNSAAVGLLLYFAYFVLRGSFKEPQQRAKISAVYNIFAFAALIPLLFILPRMTDSLHPGNGGNPGFGGYDLDSRMRMVFYPSILAWTLIGLWMVNVKYRLSLLQQKLYENQ